MKRFWIILLSLTLVLSLAACGQGPASSDTGAQTPSGSDSQTEDGETESQAPEADGGTESTDGETQQPAEDEPAEQAPEETPSEDDAAAEEPATDAGGETGPAQSDLDALTAVLDQIRTDGRVGTAGSSLTNAYLAATLLDWAEGTPLTEEECTAAAIDWYAAIPADELDPELADVFDAIYAVCGELMTEGQEGLLSDCGYTGGGYPWSEEAGARALAALNGVVGG